MQSHILILDENEQDAKALAELLSHEDYRVSFPPPGNGLISRILEIDPDCMFIERSVGDIDAVEFIRLVRREPTLESVPIFLLTNSDSYPLHLDALRAGANVYLTKPYDRAELTTVLDAQLRLRRLQMELQEQLELNQALLMQLQADLSLGQQVQKSFLPPNQLITDNFTLEARLIPSGDLSGDYFDYRLITPDRLAIFLADVSGHGIASALLASRLKAFFDENYRRLHKPAMFLEQLNRVMNDLGDHFHIATAICLHIDVVESEITYANAGHRSMYWIESDRARSKELPASGPGLGMFSEFEVEEHSFAFLPGRNRLVTFTDGLVEFRRTDGMWLTEENYRDGVMLPNAQLPLPEYVELLLKRSREHTCTGHWEDDVSILVVDF